MANIHCLLRHDYSIGGGTECYVFKPHIPLKGVNAVRVQFPQVWIDAFDVVHALTGEPGEKRFAEFASQNHIQEFSGAMSELAKGRVLVTDAIDGRAYISPTLLWTLVGFLLPEFTCKREMELAGLGHTDPIQFRVEMKLLSRKMDQTRLNTLKDIMEVENRFVHMAESIRRSVHPSDDLSEEARNVLKAHADLFLAELASRKREAGFKSCIDACFVADQVMSHISRTCPQTLTDEFRKEVGDGLKRMLMQTIASLSTPEPEPVSNWSIPGLDDFDPNAAFTHEEQVGVVQGDNNV
eukprot:jgi/Mesvir1/7792/Mv11735-RA.1